MSESAEKWIKGLPVPQTTLANIENVIVDFVKPTLPDRLRKEGKIKKRMDARLITGPQKCHPDPAAGKDDFPAGPLQYGLGGEHCKYSELGHGVCHDVPFGPGYELTFSLVIY